MGVSSISVEHSVIRQFNFDFDIKKRRERISLSYGIGNKTGWQYASGGR